MFNREPRQPRIDTLIGRSTRLQGDLVFSGGLHLDGRIVGNVTAEPGTSSSLSVSETAAIEGAVDVPIVVLHGSVTGDIYARDRLVLGASARVQGNVCYGVIEMTLGAEITGKLAQVPEGTGQASPAEGSAQAPAG